MIEIVDQSNSDLYSQNQDLINNFTDYSSKNLDFDKPVKVYFMDDEENAKDPLGKTAHYNPDTLEIKIYVTGRHLKDILRSISHELIHHVQNCRGDLGSLDSTEAGYAQSNDHLRGMEQEAYTQGNIMNFRDFEDNYKRGTKTMSETKINKLKAVIREVLKEQYQDEDPKIQSLLTRADNAMKEDDLLMAGNFLSNAYKAGAEDSNIPMNALSMYIAARNQESEAGNHDRAKQINDIATRFARLVAEDWAGNQLDKNAMSNLSLRVKDLNAYTKGDQTSVAQASGAGPKTSRTRTKTRYKFCAEPPYEKGCKGSTVAYVQKLLFKALGGQMNEQDSAEDKFSDTFFGEKTEIAVKKFQEKVGLEQTGVVDQETLDRLKAAVQSAQAPAQATARGPQAPAQAAPAAAGPAAADTP